MREDPTGKRALFSTQAHAQPKTNGKKALFSDQWRPGTPIAVDCSACGRTTEIAITDALLRLFRFGLLIPTKEYPILIRCPACGRRAWVKARPA